MSKEEEIEELERQLERLNRASVKASSVVLSELVEQIEWIENKLKVLKDEQD